MNPFNPTTQVNNVANALNQRAMDTYGPFDVSIGSPGLSAPVQQAAPAVDPYAAWGGRAGLDQARNSIFENFNIGADKTAGDYGAGVRDLVQGYKSGQDTLNRAGAQNDLSKIQGTQNVMGMVNRGIASGRSLLANKNASDSSAAGAIANAYGKIGQGELSKVGNQYALTGEDIARQQQTFDESMTNKYADIARNKENTVNQLVMAAKDQISTLNAQMANASIPDRIALEQEAARLKGELLGKLQKFDGDLASAKSNNTAWDPNARRAEALRLSQAGVAASNPFQFSQEAPLQAQPGPDVGNLPIYTFNRNRQQG